MTDTTANPAPEPTAQPGSIDPLQLAIDELAMNTVPMPEDLLADVDVLSLSYYSFLTLDYTLRAFTAAISSDAGADLTEGDAPLRAIDAIGMAAGNLRQACIELGIFDG